MHLLFLLSHTPSAVLFCIAYTSHNINTFVIFYYIIGAHFLPWLDSTIRPCPTAPTYPLLGRIRGNNRLLCVRFFCSSLLSDNHPYVFSSTVDRWPQSQFLLNGLAAPSAIGWAQQRTHNFIYIFIICRAVRYFFYCSDATSTQVRVTGQGSLLSSSKWFTDEFKKNKTKHKKNLHFLCHSMREGNS